MEFFPHEIVREGQSHLIEDLDLAFAEGKTLLAHAPTGLGKTASALSVALKYAFQKDKKIFFLTNRHTQHKIAVDTLRMIRKKTGKNISVVDLIGKKWMCNQEISQLFGTDFNEFCRTLVEKGECEFYSNVHDKNGLTVQAQVLVKRLQDEGPLANEELVLVGAEEKMCSYELALSMAKKAKVIIGDYYYLFNPFVQSTIMKKMQVEMDDVILIVDEGHNLPSRVTDMLSSSLSSIMIKNSIMEAKKFGYQGLIHWLQELNSIINHLGEFEKDKEKLVRKDDFIYRIKKVVNYDTFIDELEIAADEIRKKQRKSYLGGISSFLESWQGADEGYVRTIEEKSGRNGSFLVLQYSCLDPAIATKEIFQKVHAAVVMSGTLSPTFMYKDVLGITNAVEKTYTSPFPPENRLSLIIPETSTKFTLRNEVMYKTIAEKCSDLAALIPGNVAFFFPSYSLRDEICQFFRSSKELFWEKSDMSKEEKEVFLNDFKQVKDKGGVLLGVTGANFAEGVDFPGDLLQGVVVVGLPLARPTLKNQEVIKYYDQKYHKGWDYGYIFPAMNKCIQSAGRCIRSETDKGAVIYLEERFAWQKYYDCFPDRIGLRVSKDYSKFVKEFFS